VELYLPSHIIFYGVRKDSFTSNYYEISLFVDILDVFSRKKLPLHISIFE